MTSTADCECDLGLTLQANGCEPCSGGYKDFVGDAACVVCPGGHGGAQRRGAGAPFFRSQGGLGAESLGSELHTT